MKAIIFVLKLLGNWKASRLIGYLQPLYPVSFPCSAVDSAQRDVDVSSLRAVKCHSTELLLYLCLLYLC